MAELQGKRRKIDCSVQKRGMDKDSDNKIELKKRIGLLGAVSFSLGSIIGSGIFISPTGIAREMGSVGGSLVIWLACGVMALAITQVYAELASYMPLSGGDYAYQKRALGSPVAFLFVWVGLSAIRPASVATLSLACSRYTLSLFFTDDFGDVPFTNFKLLAVAILLLVYAFNCYNTKWAKTIQIIFTFAKCLGLAIIIIMGFVNIVQGIRVNELYIGRTKNFQNAFEGTTNNPAGIAVAFYNGLWAYNGWANLPYVAEEVIHPERNLPLALWIPMPLVMALYLLTNISYFTVLDVEEMLSSDVVAMAWAEKTEASLVALVSVAVALSTFGSCNGTVYTASRIVYAAARDGNWLVILSTIQHRFFTPIAAIVYMSLFSMVFTLTDVQTLITFSGFTYWIFYFLTSLSCIVLRYKYPDEPRPYKVNILVPIIVCLFSAYLVVSPIIFSDDRMPYVYGMIFILSGLVFYFIFVFLGWKMPGFDYITVFFQLLYQACPEESVEETKRKDSYISTTVTSL